MQRSLFFAALLGLVGSLAMTGDAQACHKRKACAEPCAAPAPPPPAPCPPPPPVCEPAPKHCGLKMPKMNLFGCFKKKAHCAPAPVAYAAPAPVHYAYYAPAAPVYAAPQATPQASGQY